MAVRKFLNAIFESIIDKELCSACGTCLDRCPVKAISLNDTARVNRELCLGCGLCESVCPEEAIKLKLRDDREEPYERVLSMGKAIIEEKRRIRKIR